MAERSELEFEPQLVIGVTMTTTKTEAQSKAKPKKPYSPPQLISYGHVRSLTLAGRGRTTEGGGASTSRVRRPSDRATKERIVRIGVHPLGIGLYLFDYKPGYRAAWGYGRQFGVMADEVESVMPQAVSVHPEGYKIVDYRMLGISRSMQ
jgi:hypothetical protein